MSDIHYIKIEDLTLYQTQLTELLAQCVQDGASIGFLPDEPIQHYVEYWQNVAVDINKQKTFLWLALVNEKVVGSIQLVRAMKAKGLH